MKILITGANGFIGKNLISKLEQNSIHDIYACDTNTSLVLLEKYCQECEFVYQLAGVNRPEDVSEYMKGNCGFLAKLLELLRKSGNTCPIMFSSSIQAVLENPYGISKLEGEKLLEEYRKETNARVYIYRLPNVFGKWCRPNYNSVVATFCHNIANNLPIFISDETKPINLVYIDDLIDELIGLLDNTDTEQKYYTLEGYQTTLGEIAKLLYSFQNGRETLDVPDVTEGGFSKKLYSTYLSYLPTDSFKYPLKMNRDKRGSFTEILRTSERGQFSINISKPGVEKGNHWHHTKCEKFVVVQGEALIQLRKIGEQEVISYHVSGDCLEAVDIPPGYTHNIINKGTTDLITFMWCNECFQPDKPDTYYLGVNEVEANE